MPQQSVLVEFIFVGPVTATDQLQVKYIPSLLSLHSLGRSLASGAAQCEGRITSVCVECNKRVQSCSSVGLTVCARELSLERAQDLLQASFSVIAYIVLRTVDCFDFLQWNCKL